MKKLTLILMVGLTSIQSTYAQDYFAVADNHLGGRTMLTEQSCRFDKTLPEAFTTDNKGNKTYSCYWFGINKVFFQNEKRHISSMPKRDFQIVLSVI